MPFLTGITLSLGVAVFGRRAGLDRNRAFYATIVIVVASYYVLFAVIGGSTTAVVAESAVMALFTTAAVAGFRSSSWILAGALAAHGVFDAVHGGLLHNPGVPVWWPAFCGAYDVGAAAWLAWLTVRDDRGARARREREVRTSRVSGGRARARGPVEALAAALSADRRC